MKIKNILITSDDGYNSLGIRLLAHFLKKDYQVNVAGTTTQQSGVGGKLSLKNGGSWGVKKINNIKTLWVEGTPVDTIDVCLSYFEKTFDLVISGINWGANIGASLITSGTFAAAFRALGVDLSKKAISLSWNLPAEKFFSPNKKVKLSKKLIQYPGRAAKKIIKQAIDNNFWEADLLNINLPKNKSKKVKFVKTLPDLKRYFKYPLHLDEKSRTFRYPPGQSENLETNQAFEAVALENGFITFTPCKANMTSDKIYQELKKTSFPLK